MPMTHSTIRWISIPPRVASLNYPAVIFHRAPEMALAPGYRGGPANPNSALLAGCVGSLASNDLHKLVIFHSCMLTILRWSPPLKYSSGGMATNQICGAMVKSLVPGTGIPPSGHAHHYSGFAIWYTYLSFPHHCPSCLDAHSGMNDHKPIYVHIYIYINQYKPM